MKPTDGAATAAPASEGLAAGQRVILWLFVALAVATALTLLYFATLVEPRFRPRIYAALAGDLLLPVVAWFAFRAMARRRDGREAKAE